MARLVAHVVGARPNFMKAAPVIAALRKRRLDQTVIHTGQHYDKAMSDVFFADLDLPDPDINLGVGSGSHAQQTAALVTGLEQAFLDVAPALILVYGDVNSTLAAALVAAKLLIPLGHVEAGLRSFDMTMPEEVNRKVTDTLADLLFVTSPEGIGHLGNEGCAIERIHFVGNPMIDTLLASAGSLDPDAARRDVGLDQQPYAVATLHRPANVDTPEAAAALVRMLAEVSTMLTVVLPLHPRGRPALERAGLLSNEHIRVVEPLGYVDFLSLVRGARLVLTDSGGIQEETTVLGIPCVTIRPNTERPITITHGTNQLATPAAVPGIVRDLLQRAGGGPSEQPPLWDGKAGERIATVVERYLVDTASEQIHVG